MKKITPLTCHWLNFPDTTKCCEWKTSLVSSRNENNWYLSVWMTRTDIKPLESIKFKFIIHFKSLFVFSSQKWRKYDFVRCRKIHSSTGPSFPLYPSIILYIVKSDSVFVHIIFMCARYGLCEIVSFLVALFVSWDSCGNSNGANEPNRIFCDQNWWAAQLSPFCHAQCAMCTIRIHNTTWDKTV